MKTDNVFKVVEPDLDFIVGEFRTLSEAVKFVNDCIEWDKNNPQYYVPSYRIEQ